MPQPNSEIIIYQNQEGNIKVDVRLEDETVWVTQAGNPSKKLYNMPRRGYLFVEK